MAKIVPLRGFIVQHHLIISDHGVDLIDGGFMGGVKRIKKALADHGKTLSDIRSLFLTHGHLDHTLNALKIQKLTGCRVYAPRADRGHLNGRHRYRGWSRIGGGLEQIGRLVFRYQAPRVDQWFVPGDLIHGLEVIGLPGHTQGHCGFLQGESKLLFVGDLFTDHFGRPSAPPAILNDDCGLSHASIRKAASLDLEGVFLNHGRRAEPSENLRKLQWLANRD